MNNDDTPDNSQYLKYAAAAVILNVKIATLYSWVSRGLIPHVRLSPRVVRFRRDDLDRWLEQRRFIPSRTPLHPHAPHPTGGGHDR